MSEEQRRILEMLAGGKINADEADRLLRVIDQAQNTGPGRTAAASEQRGYRHDHERVSVIVEPDTDAVSGDVCDDTFTVGESPRLIVNAENGGVVVNAGVDNEIRVHARLKNASRVDYHVTQEGDAIRVEARQKGKPSLFGFFGLGMGVQITVTTPRNTSVDLNSSNGRIELRGVENSGTLYTSNGPISMEGVKGDFEAATSNSRIELKDAEGSATLRTSNGRISMESVKGRFTAITSNGSISFDGEMLPGGENQFKTSNGSVRVRLHGEPGLEIDAATSNGSVTCELPALTASIRKRNRLVGAIGDAKASLTIQTSNGSVGIE